MEVVEDHPSLVTLPFELKLVIFSYLDVNSVLSLSSLSHDFNSSTTCDEFYQYVVEKDCILLRLSSFRGDFVTYLSHHLNHASWKMIYKHMVVLPFLERKFIATIEFPLLWKPNEDIHQYLPRIMRLETIIWVVTSKYYDQYTHVQELEDTIITGHHCFSTLSQFFLLLLTRYCIPSVDPDQSQKHEDDIVENIRLRVCRVMSRWAQKNQHDILLNRSLCTIIRQFVTYMLTPEHRKMMEGVREMISFSQVQKAISHVCDESHMIINNGNSANIDINNNNNNSNTNGTSAGTNQFYTNSINNNVKYVNNNNNTNNDEIEPSSPSLQVKLDDNDFTINNKTFQEEIEEGDTERRNINEINRNNITPFGNNGVVRYPPLFSASLENCHLNILECDVDILAQEIASFDWELYYRIKVSEIMDKSWRHANKFLFSPNIVASIKWFNHVSFWVATEVLNFPKIKLRSQALSCFIQLALKCYDLRDFHSVFSILAGLNMACIHRLRNTWEAVPKKLQDSFTRMSSFITGVNGDFLAYKTTLKNSGLPAVPYLGCLLNDITFVLDTSEKLKFPQLYLHKVVVMSKIVSEFVRYQVVPYPSSPPQYLNQLRNVKVLDASELYRKSLEVEPKLSLRFSSPSLFSPFGNNNNNNNN